MSAFLTVPGPNNVRIIRASCGQNTDVLQSVDYRVSLPQMTGVSAEFRFTDALWPRSSFPGQNNSAGFQNGISESAHQAWEWNWPPTGCHVPKVVSGIVKDSNGNPVAGATVQLFNTATGQLVDTQVSAADGSYRCGDPNAVASFAVGYLPGSPDTAGTTVDTLTGV